MSKSTRGVWVVSVFDGARAKSVLELGDAGIGYIILERSGSKFAMTCTAAFRIVPENNPIPTHLEEVKDPYKVAEYEKIRKARSGIIEKELQK